MRTLHCLICAGEIEQRGDRFSCLSAELGGKYAPALGHSIRRAVYGVDPPAAETRAPQIAPYLWCPNCTAELEEYEARGRRLACATCGLQLPATDQLELMQVKEAHGGVNDWT